MSDTIEQRLARCQAYNHTLTKMMMGLIQTIEERGIPNQATVIRAIETALRAAVEASSSPDVPAHD